MSDQKRAPRSVADPDRDAYERSVHKNEALQAERERRESARQAWLDRAADIGGDIATAIDAGVDSAKKAVRDPRVQRVLTKSARLISPVGPSISLHEARRRYQKDVSNGMPTDEAFVKATGGLVGGEVGGKLGMAGGALAIGGAAALSSGPPTAPVGAAIGGFFGGLEGQDRGEELGQRVVEPYRGAKAWAKGVTRPLYDPIHLYDVMSMRR
jgi:hypothetical protein